MVGISSVAGCRFNEASSAKFLDCPSDYQLLKKEIFFHSSF
jgi:hypothetical protein